MARIVKEEAYAVKRNEILDAAQRLVYTKGYEQMTIQDMLDDLQISKGAFYHYFDSKQAVLEALVERMGEGAVQLLLPIVHDPLLPALDKFHCYLATLNRWKVGQSLFSRAVACLVHRRQRHRAPETVRSRDPGDCTSTHRDYPPGYPGRGHDGRLPRSGRRSNGVSGAGRRRSDWRAASLV